MFCKKDNIHAAIKPIHNHLNETAERNNTKLLVKSHEFDQIIIEIGSNTMLSQMAK